MFSHLFSHFGKVGKHSVCIYPNLPDCVLHATGPSNLKAPLFTWDALLSLYLRTICASLRHVSIVIRLGLFVVCWNTLFIGK